MSTPAFASTEKVPVGVGTQIGYGTGLIAFVLAIVSYLSGNGGDEDTVNTIVTGAVSLGMLGVTTLGRMLQAAAAKKGIALADAAKYAQVDIDEEAVKAAVEKALAGALSDFDDSRHAAVEGEPGGIVTPGVGLDDHVEVHDPESSRPVV
jgi:hypothetical protein